MIADVTTCGCFTRATVIDTREAGLGQLGFAFPITAVYIAVAVVACFIVCALTAVTEAAVRAAEFVGAIGNTGLATTALIDTRVDAEAVPGSATAERITITYTVLAEATAATRHVARYATQGVSCTG